MPAPSRRRKRVDLVSGLAHDHAMATREPRSGSGAPKKKLPAKGSPTKGADVEAAAEAIRDAIVGDHTLATVEHLTLDMKSVRSLEPLREASNLESLQLERGRVPDLSPLATLPRLSSVLFSDGAVVEDLSPLDGCPALTELLLAQHAAALGTLHRALRSLEIADVTLTDPRVFAGVTDLETLTLGGLARGRYVAVPDGAKWPSLPSLRALSLLSRCATDLSFLKAAPGLTALYCAGNKKLRALTGIERCRKLQALVAWSTSVADLTPLAGLPLRRVALSSSKVQDLTPLADAPLETLVASNTRVRSLDGLDACPALVELDVGACDRLTSVQALGAHRALRFLNLSQTSVQDFSPLAGATSLEVLSLRGTSFVDAELLLALPNLKEVYVEETPLGADTKACAKLKKRMTSRGGDLYTGSVTPLWKHWPRPALDAWMRMR